MRRAVPLVLLAVLVAGCSTGPDTAPVATPGAPTPAQPGGPGLPADPAAPVLETTVVRVGGVAVTAEVADDDEERRQGLRGRAGVPPGTGMVFRYPEPAPRRFTMSGVTFPLVGVFASGGVVVGVEQMVPCEGTIEECPTYGPDAPADTVLEVAPGTLPDVAVGDRLVDADR